jgi:hypothetical protein
MPFLVRGFFLVAAWGLANTTTSRVNLFDQSDRQACDATPDLTNRALRHRTMQSRILSR